MLRIAAAEDLTALTRLRRAATGDSAEDAAGWLQRVRILRQGRKVLS